MGAMLEYDAGASFIAEDLHRVSVPNHVGPSGQPTNVYIVGRHSAILIDSGSDDGGITVLNALDRLGIGEIDRIILTHAHSDLAGSAPALQLATGAAVELHPRAVGLSTRRAVALNVDRYLVDGETVSAGRYSFTVVETPGHAPGHVSLYEPTLRALFAGDLLSGNGTVAIVPPNGSMGDYLRSLHRVSALSIDTIYPGHGPAIPNGTDRIAQYIQHRERREEQIYQQIAAGRDTVDAITDVLYKEVRPRIRPQAAGTVLAHVINLMERGRVQVIEKTENLATARFRSLG